MLYYKRFRVFCFVLLMFYIIDIIVSYINVFLYETLLDTLFFIGFSLYLYIVYRNTEEIKKNKYCRKLDKIYLATVILVLMCFLGYLIYSFQNSFFTVLVFCVIVLYFICFIKIITTIQNHLSDKNILYYILAYIFFPLSLIYSLRIVKQANCYSSDPTRVKK